jgi:hypothetical protein
MQDTSDSDKQRRSAGAVPRRSTASPAEFAGALWNPKRRIRDGVYQLRKQQSGRREKGKRRALSFEEQPASKHSKFPIWLAVLGFLLVAGTLTAFLILRSGQRANAGKTAKRVMADQTFDSGSLKDWKGELPMKAAEGFIRAKSDEERLRFVRDPERVAPIMRSFFSEGPGAKESPAALVPLRSLQTREMAAEEFRVDFADGGNRLVCVVLADDSAKVDFECYARHGSVSWDDLLSGKAEFAGEVRLVVSAESYYNFGFSDDRKWSSFAARSPDVPIDLVLYAELGSDAEKILSEVTAGGSALTTLAIRGVQGSHKHRQFEVTEVLARSWVVFSGGAAGGR